MVGFSNPERPMLLPPESMPWGRWAQDCISQNSENIGLAQSEQRNAQMVFNSRADSITDQMYAIDGLAEITLIDVPNFDRTFAGSIPLEDQQFVFSPDFEIPLTRPLSNGFVFAEVKAVRLSGGLFTYMGGCSAFITTIGYRSATTVSSQSAPPYSETCFGSVSSLFSRNSTGSTSGITARFGIRTLYPGPTSSPLSVRFSGCKIGIVEIGKLQR